MKDWIVEKYGLTKEGREHGIANVPYPFWVEGKNLSDKGRSFYWIMPDIDDERFDFANAIAILDNSIEYKLEKRLIII